MLILCLNLCPLSGLEHWSESRYFYDCVLDGFSAFVGGGGDEKEVLGVELSYAVAQHIFIEFIINEEVQSTVFFVERLPYYAVIPIHYSGTA